MKAFDHRSLGLAGMVLGVLLLVAPPAFAAYTHVERRGFSHGDGNLGLVDRFADWTGGNSGNYLVGKSQSAQGDAYCTETWADYKFRDGTHHNPYLFRRCSYDPNFDNSPGTRTPVFMSRTLNALKVVVCVVPDERPNTPITRGPQNCVGDLEHIDLRSGRTYDDIRTNAEQDPSGVIIYEQG